jgi:pentatricopeptide repeat protein
MKKATFIFIIFSLVCGNFFPQQFTLDSFKHESYTHSNDTVRLKSFKKISKLFIDSQIDSSLFYAQAMLAFAKEKQILYYISDAYDLISNVYEQKGELENCVASIDSAKYYANLIDDPVGVIYFATNEGSTYIKMGRYFEALQCFEEMKNIGVKINRPSRVAAALNNIGAVYSKYGNYDEALEYHSKALQTSIIENDDYNYLFKRKKL